MPMHDVGPYRIERLIGAGADGRVYRGVAPDGRRVAVKVLRPEALPGGDTDERWLDEARVGASVDHENVVRVLDAGIARSGAQARRYVVLELVEGSNLRDVLRSAGRLPERVCLDIGTQVVRGLEQIHARAAVHGDVKPENVMICDDGTVKVIDLGLAARVAGTSDAGRDRARGGTLLYTAPEMLRADGPGRDGRADLYGLGLMLHEMVTGRHPFSGLDAPRVAHAQLTGRIPSLDRGSRRVSRLFALLVRTLTARHPDDRARTTADAVDAFERRHDSRWWRRVRGNVDANARRPGAAGANAQHRDDGARDAAPLHGRAAPLRRLRRLLADAADARGSVAIVSGDAGIGKSRLVDAVVAAARRAAPDVVVLRGAYAACGRQSTTRPYLEALREAIGVPGVRAATARCGGPADVAAFRSLLAGSPLPRGVPAPAAPALRRMLTTTLRRIAARRPVLLVVEDAHFGPPDAESFAAGLGEAIAGARILVVATTRGRDLAGTRGSEHCARVELPPLGRAPVRALLRTSLGSEETAEALLGPVLRESGGNPLAIESVIGDLRESRRLARGADGTWTLTSPVTDLATPREVADVIRTRIRRLRAPERALLETLAVLGPAGDLDVVADLCGPRRGPVSDEAPATRKALRDNVRRRLELLAARTSLVRAVPGGFELGHHRIADCVLAEMRPADLRRLHGRTADALAAHRGAGTPAAELEREVSVFEHRLAAGDAASIGARFVARLSELVACGQRERASAMMKAAYGLRRTLDASTLVALVVEFDRQGILDAAEVRDLRPLRDAVRRAKDLPDPRLWIAASFRLAARRSYLGQYDGTFAIVRAAHRVARRLGDAALRAQAMMRLSEAENGRRGPRRTVLCARAAVAAARRAGDTSLIVTAGLNLDDVAARVGDVRWRAAGLEVASAALPASRRKTHANYLLHRAEFLECSGRWLEMIPAARVAIRAMQANGREGLEAALHFDLTRALVATGRLRAARAAAARGSALGRLRGHVRLAPREEEAHAELAFAEGRIGDAVAGIARATASCLSVGGKDEAWFCNASAARLFAIVGRDVHLDDLARTPTRAPGIDYTIARETAGARLLELRDDRTGAAAAWERVADHARSAGLTGTERCAALEAAVAAWESGAAAADAALPHVRAARDEARRSSTPELEATALVYEALLEPRRRVAAAAAAAALLPRVAVPARVRIGWLLWRATGEPRHLALAATTLRRLIAAAPFDDRVRMRTSVPLHRAVLEASASASATPASDARRVASMPRTVHARRATPRVVSGAAGAHVR